MRKFCAAFNARKLPLHLLVANAGIMSPATRLVTEDGLEMQFQVNFLGHWLMAHELMAEQRRRRAAAHGKGAGSVTASAAGRGTREGEEAREGWLPGWGLPEDGCRLVLVSSLMHHAGMLDWNDMQVRVWIGGEVCCCPCGVHPPQRAPQQMTGEATP